MATTPLELRSFTSLSLGGSQAVSFTQFNPTLGTLTGITVTLESGVLSQARVENLGAIDATLTIGVSGVVSVNTPSGYIGLMATIAPSATVSLGAFDGASDFLGGSGTVAALGLESGPLSITVMPSGSDLAAFVGTGTVDLSVLTSGQSRQAGTANWLSEIVSNADGTVGLQYEFTPPTGGGTGSVGSEFTSSFIPSTLGSISSFPSSTITAAQTFTLDNAITGWTRSIDVARFDASLGALLAINVGLVLDTRTDLSIENLSPVPIAAVVNDEVTYSITTQGTQVFSSNYLANGAVVRPTDVILEAFDGTADFAGTSGQVLTGYAAVDDATNQFQITNSSLLAAFIGSGTEAMSVATMGAAFARGGASQRMLLNQQAGAVVSVSYVYSAEAPACFAAGTRIATPNGPIAVESLIPGQIVKLADGSTASIVWIGHRTIDCARHPDPAAVHPIRVARGAFAPGMPARDLYLSPDHAVFTDDVLIPVRHLVNGTTVRRCPVDHVTYFHVELPRHAALLAENLPAESYLDTGDRSAFANGGPVIQAHPRFGAAVREARGFAPLVVTGAMIDAVRVRLAQRTAPVAASTSRNGHRRRVRTGTGPGT